MGQSLTVCQRNGKTRYQLDSYTQLCTVKSAEQKCALLGEDTITLKLTSAKPLHFVVGDYMQVFGSVYTLNKFDEPTKNGEGDFEYSLVFEGLQYKLLAAQYRSADALGMNPTAEFSLVCDMRMAMGVLVNNMNRVAAPDKEVWELGECMDTEFKEYSFSRENCLSVLQRLCQDNKCEFEIQALGNRRYRLNIKQKVGSLFPAKFTFGRGGGIYQLRRRNINNDDVISRLYVEGGTQNITSKYRNGAQRLRLAVNAESYIEDELAIKAFGVKEGSRTYDDIFPTRTGYVTSVVDGDVLSFVDEEMFDLNEKDANGTKYLIDGTPAKVKFTGSSNLAGYTFDIHSYDHKTHKFTLVRYEDSRGMKYPSDTAGAYQIEKGATYVLLDIVMPQDPYEVDAEAKLLERAKADLAADCQPKVSYELDIESMSLERAYGSEMGITNVFQLGDLLHIVDADINVDKAIRLTGFTRDCYSQPYKYKLTLSDTIEVSLIQSILEDIDQQEQDIVDLTNKTNVELMRLQWRTTQELLGMVFDADGYFDTSHIRPSSIETLMLSVGNRNGQFIMRDVIVTCNALAGGKPNPQLFTIQSNGGILQHYAIEENIRTWQVLNDTITLQSSGAMYLYAQCPKTGSTCRLILSQNRMATEVGTYYYFLVGVLSSIYNGYRELTTTYGNTRITGRCINCGRIESADKQTYFDLDNSEIGGNIKFRSTTGDLLDISELEQQLNDSTDLLKAIRDNYTQVEGGLILSTFLKLGALQSNGQWVESAGLKAMLSNRNEIAAYFGGTYAEALAGTKAGMTVIYHNGRLKAQNADITGIIHATGGEFDGYIKTMFKQVEDSDATYLGGGFNRGAWRLNKDLNIACSHCGIELPSSKDYIGSRVLINNDCFMYTRGGDWTTKVTVQGGGKLYGTLDSSQALDNREFPSSISFASAIVEFVGFADPENTSKCSWSVLNYNPNLDYYGTRVMPKCVAYGRVNGNTSGASIEYNSFGGISVRRISKGRYRLTFTKAYSYASRYHVILQGVGWCYGENKDRSTAWIKASLIDQQAGYFEVGLSDDETCNDGSFNYMVIEM